MKKLLIVTMALFFAFGFTFQSKTDPRLVGKWEGSEKNNQKEGVKKSWIMTRRPNGNYIIEFTTIDEDGNKNTQIEKGKWWTNGNDFYEQYEESDSPTVYSYKILDNKTIYFKMKKSDSNFDNPDYEFIDKKID